MRAFNRLTVLAAGCLSVMVAWAIVTSPASAQPWPQRPVRLIIPLPPGTGTDISGRLLAEQSIQALGSRRRGGEPPGRRRHPGGHRIPGRSRRPHLADVVRRHHHHQPAAARSAALRSGRRPCPDRAGRGQLSRRLGERDVEGRYACRLRQRRQGAAGQAQLGGNAGPALLHPVGAHEERRRSTWCRCPIAISPRPRRI